MLLVHVSEINERNRSVAISLDKKKYASKLVVGEKSIQHTEAKPEIHREAVNM